jgi:hypothetical protein
MDDFIPISLPSRCLTYVDQEHKPISPGDVKARAYRGSDEIYLTQINPLNLEKNYFEVLKSVLQGVDPVQLTLGDRMYLILWEYVNSYSRTMKLKTICSNCLSEVEILVDLGTLENRELPEDFKQPFPVTLPKSGEKVQLRLLTAGDEIEVERYSRKHKKTALLYRYARTIVEDMDVIARTENLASMEAKDLMAIMAFQEKFFHGPEMRTAFVCPEEDCGEEDELDIPFRLDFFFPNVSELSIFDGEGV